LLFSQILNFLLDFLILGQVRIHEFVCVDDLIKLKLLLILHKHLLLDVIVHSINREEENSGELLYPSFFNALNSCSPRLLSVHEERLSDLLTVEIINVFKALRSPGIIQGRVSVDIQHHRSHLLNLFVEYLVSCAIFNLEDIDGPAKE